MTEPPDTTRRDLLRLMVATAAATLTSGWALFAGAQPGNFSAIYGDPRLRQRFLLFLANIFHLYPERELHELIERIARTSGDDHQAYETLLSEIPSIKPFMQLVRYALPALRRQKKVMCEQTVALLDGRTRFGRYVEIGTTGRYFDRLSDAVSFDEPPVFVHTDQPSYQPNDIAERGRISKVGSFLPLGAYDPLALPEGSVDLLTVYIGFHHAPIARREPFIRSCHRALRAGGSLIVRDHDVTDPAMTHLVALAHDVFNCGLTLPWQTNAAEIRNFLSLAQLEDLLVASGFTPRGGRLTQTGDPTRNTLMRFDKG